MTTADRLIAEVEEVCECTIRPDGSVLHTPPTKKKCKDGVYTTLPDTGNQAGQKVVYLRPK